MEYILIDFFTHSITGFNINTYLYALNHLNLKKYITSSLILFLLSENINLIIILSIMYTINILIFKYINRSFVFELALYACFYYILYKIDIFFVLNIFLVIILKLTKYHVSSRRGHGKIKSS